MSADGRSDGRGIQIPADVAAAVNLPEDLDANTLGEFTIPDITQRRSAGYVYVVAATLAAGGALAGLGFGYWIAVGVLAAIAAYYMASGKKLQVFEDEALELANRSTDFAVGHASAVLGFDGLLARPIWNVLVFSADDPPSQRGLVRVDARAGSIIEQYVEPIVE